MLPLKQRQYKTNALHMTDKSRQTGQMASSISTSWQG